MKLVADRIYVTHPGPLPMTRYLETKGMPVARGLILAAERDDRVAFQILPFKNFTREDRIRLIPDVAGDLALELARDEC